MTPAGHTQPANVVDELSAYRGYRYQVGGGAAFFLGLLTAGLYPGLAVITRMRRHRAEESRLFFRAIDHLRQYIGRVPELDRAEALADRMRRKSSRGVVAILTAIALSLALIGLAPALALVFEEGIRIGQARQPRVTVVRTSDFEGTMVLAGDPGWEPSKGGKYVPPPGPVYPTYPGETEWADAEEVSRRSAALRRGKALESGALASVIVIGGLLALWAALAVGGLADHRFRTGALLRELNGVAVARGASPVRTYPAGLSGGQIFWLILVILMGGGLGLGPAAAAFDRVPGLEDEVVIPVYMALCAVVWGTYVLVAMIWSNHARRWNEAVMAGLAQTVSALSHAPVRVSAVAEGPRHCKSASCGVPNLPVARYCCRCGQPL